MRHEHAGHRKRLLVRLRAGETLLEQEQLEVILFPLLPRRNTNDLAHRLLAKFGTLQGVFSATEQQLREVEGIGRRLADNLVAIGRALERLLRTGAGWKFESRSFVGLMQKEYAKIGYEVTDIYPLNDAGEITGCYRFSDKDKHKVTLHGATISRILLKERPSGLVVVHNHPESGAKASVADENMTRTCQVLCNLHGVLLCDHIIFSKDGHYSYYLSDALKDIHADFAAHTLIQGKE